MYGDERPHDKTLKVNPRLLYFSSTSACSDIAHFVRVQCLIQRVYVCFCVRARTCLCVRACAGVRVCVSPCVRAPACGFTASQISLNAHCCKAAAECNLTLTL